MASTGSKVRDRIIVSGMTSFTECGKMHHRMRPPPLPNEGAAGPVMAQLYTVDPDAANYRFQNIFST